MTNRERVRRCGQCLPIDRAPFSFYFGPWPETRALWAQEGVTNPDAWREGFDFDPPVVSLFGHVNHLYLPGYETKILERHGERIISQNNLGEIIESVEGKSGIPKILRSPVTCLSDWEEIKAKRLDPEDPARFPADWKERARCINEQDAPVQIGAYPCGLFGTLRDLMGVEDCLVAFYDDPELVKRIMDDLTDFWLAIFEKICKDVQVDILHIWEDMSGKQGSLISPEFIKEFMLPNYRRFKAFADAHDIAVFQVDTDGDCEELIPLFASAGVNMMLPFEVTAGCDVVAWRRKYPNMSMMGGIDKLEIAKGKEATERELARIAPLLEDTGYFPALDHLIPPEIHFDDYAYFVRRLREMIFERAR